MSAFIFRLDGKRFCFGADEKLEEDAEDGKEGEYAAISPEFGWTCSRGRDARETAEDEEEEEEEDDGGGCPDPLGSLIPCLKAMVIKTVFQEIKGLGYQGHG